MVETYATIHSDYWRVYLILGEYGYDHLAVNHSRTFVDPLTGANTQKIEGLWALVKQQFKAMKGIDPKYLQDYLDEFTFRRTFENSPITLFGEMLLTISRYWNQVGNMDDFDYVDLLEEDGRERVPIG